MTMDLDVSESKAAKKKKWEANIIDHRPSLARVASMFASFRSAAAPARASTTATQQPDDTGFHSTPLVCLPLLFI